ncbi:hypothetical protein FSARC_1849 [Fusarium sarcochroum]|uniref:Uncharacterized protein n=1 Tax=Fusarium sarcochroum TaxID=1208366 RepID=A0A8H4U851_9HYPO|nr:hypothetical protein FSARC_1849 [Fusarium sarcochroum]
MDHNDIPTDRDRSVRPPSEARSSSVSGRSEASNDLETHSSQTSNNQNQEDDDDDDDEDEEDDEDDVDSNGFTIREPAYTTQEIAAIVLDFYKFLTTLHYDPAHLKIPPPEGWPTLTPEVYSGFNKSEYVYDLLRHLPYFDRSAGSVGFHYKSALIDFTTYTPENFVEENEFEDIMEFSSVEGLANPKHFFRISEGHESGGREMWLNAKDGEITEDIIRMDQCDPEDIQEYFEGFKEQYRKLELLPGPGMVTQETDRVPECDDRITEEQVLSQEDDWRTDLDIQFMRQLYRDFGWPENFRREECWEEVYRLSGKRDVLWEGMCF